MLRVYDGRSFSYKPRHGLLVVEKQKAGHDPPMRFSGPDEVPPFLREVLPLPSFVYRRPYQRGVDRLTTLKGPHKKPSPADPRAART